MVTWKMTSFTEILAQIISLADLLYGGRDNDIIYGNLGNDLIYGNHGDDVIYGGQGNDTIYGGQGNDILYGSLGDDLLFGDLGADQFVLGINSGSDTIGDFNPGQGDHVFVNGQAVLSAFTSADGGLVLAMSGGGTLTFSGITPDQFSLSWFTVSVERRLPCGALAPG